MGNSRSEVAAARSCCVVDRRAAAELDWAVRIFCNRFWAIHWTISTTMTMRCMLVGVVEAEEVETR